MNVRSPPPHLDLAKRSGGSCPDEDLLARFAEGAVAPEELEWLEAHLGECSACCVLAASVGSADAESFADESASPFIVRGSRVGRYVILDSLGVGGMGVVYSAFDPSLDRKVALKLLHTGSGPSEDAKGARDLLLQEAQSMARLCHPNVGTVFDVGLCGDRLFIAMEHVEGVSLTRWLAETQRGWREVREAFLAAGQGLAAAHRAGMVHHDFKPDNVLVGKDGRVRVMDFGLARPAPAPKVEAPTTGERAITPAQPVGGTPAYCAPEQLAGEQSDARSDQYSFCVALFEAWFGLRPAPDISTHPARLASAHGRRNVPVRLQTALMRGLQPNPEQRFASMSELLEELAWNPPSRRGLWVATAAAIAVLILGFAVAQRKSTACTGGAEQANAVWSESRQTQVRQAFLRTGVPYAAAAFVTTNEVLARWGATWTAMHQEACEATRVRHEQSDAVLALRMACLDRRLRHAAEFAELLTQADAGLVQKAAEAASGLPSIEECADVTRLMAPKRWPDDPERSGRASALQAILDRAQARFSAGRLSEAHTLAKEALAGAQPLGYRPLEAECLLTQGEVQAETGAHNDAVQSLFRAALAAREGQALEVEAQAYLALVRVVGRLQWHTERAQIYLDHAEACVERLSRNERIQGELETARAELLYYSRGRPAEAAAYARKACALLDKALGPEHPRSLWAATLLGWILMDLGHLEGSRMLLERVHTTRLRLLGPDHPEVGKSLFNLAAVQVAYGDISTAIESTERASEIWRSSLGPHHPLTLRSNVLRAECALHAGNAFEARQRLERAVPLMERAYAPNHPRVALTQVLLAESLLALQEPEAAREKFQHALALQEAESGPNHSWLADALIGIGESWLVQRDPDRARAPIERAMTLLADSGNRYASGRARFALAKVLNALGQDPTQAAQLARLAQDDLQAGRPRSAQLSELRRWMTLHH